MATANKMIYDFYLKKNGLNTGASTDYVIKDIVSLINEAWFRIYENNVQRAELDRRYEDNIRQLKVKHSKLDLDNKDGYTIAKYPKNLYKRLNQVALVSCKDCGEECTKEIPIRIVQSDDLNDARKNPYRRADFGWEQIIAEQGSEGLYVYHDNNLEIKDVYIDYYRKPVGIEAPELQQCGRYVDELDNVVTETIDFEADNTYVSIKVVDVAILLSDAATRSPQAFQLDFQKLTSLDQIS